MAYTVRNSVWDTYVGATQIIGICACCNTELILYGNFVCRHVQPRSKNGKTTIQNLRPICGICNKSLGTHNMEDFMATYGFLKSRNWNGVYVADQYDDIKED